MEIDLLADRLHRSDVHYGHEVGADIFQVHALMARAAQPQRENGSDSSYGDAAVSGAEPGIVTGLESSR